MLLGNGRYYSPNTGLRCGASILRDTPPTPSGVSSPIFMASFNSKLVSKPVGYFENAAILPMGYGGVACVITGGGVLGATPEGVADCLTSLAGNGEMTAYGYQARDIAAELSGGCTLEAAVQALASLGCEIQIGANPSAFDIAQAILNAVASQYNLPGTIGEKINGAGSAGDPWTDTRALTVAKFMGLK